MILNSNCFHSVLGSCKVICWENASSIEGEDDGGGAEGDADTAVGRRSSREVKLRKRKQTMLLAGRDLKSEDQKDIDNVPEEYCLESALYQKPYVTHKVLYAAKSFWDARCSSRIKIPENFKVLLSYFRCCSTWPSVEIPPPKKNKQKKERNIIYLKMFLVIISILPVLGA